MKYLIPIALLLTGCNFFDNPKAAPITDNMLVSVLIVDDAELAANVFADAYYSDGFCIVRIKKSVYPNCIKHEIRHCFEGKWHGDKMNSEDCFSKDKK